MFLSAFELHDKLSGATPLMLVNVCAGGDLCGNDGAYVLKHILTSKKPEAHLSGLREAYFGNLLQGKQQAQIVQSPDSGQDHIVRFVEVLEVCAGFSHPPWHYTSLNLESAAEIYMPALCRMYSVALQDDSDLWLVFCDEGISLHSLMYTSQQPNDDNGALSHHQNDGFLLMYASVSFSCTSKSFQSFLCKQVDRSCWSPANGGGPCGQNLTGKPCSGTF